MEALEKLKLLGPATRLEPAEEMVGAHRPPAGRDDDLSDCIYKFYSFTF